MLPLSSTARETNRVRPENRRRERVRPALATARRVPRRAPVHRHLDPPDQAGVGVARRPVDHHREVDGQRRARRGRRDVRHRRRDVRRGRRPAPDRPSASAGCTPMSANRFTVACCMSGARVGAPLVGVAVEAPRPLQACRSRRRARRSAACGRPRGAWPCRARRTSRTRPAAPPRRVATVVESRTSPAGRKPLSRSSSHS